MGCNCGARRSNGQTSAQMQVVESNASSTPESIANALQNAGQTSSGKDTKKVAASAR